MTSNFFSSFSFSSISDQGKHRDNNEDAQLCLNNDGAYFVADGMGGGAAGEIASHLVIHYLKKGLQGTWGESPGERKQCLNSALKGAHEKIHAHAIENNYNFMGTTVAGILFNSWNYPKAVLCHVGDSRIYRFRKEHLELLTSDHTIENDPLFAKKILDEKFSGVLTRAVGMKGNLNIDYVDIDLQGNDLFLLCTDGLSRTLEDTIIKDIIAESNLRDIPLNLTRAVSQADGKDNTTIIVVQFPKEIPAILQKTDIDIAESEYLEKIEQ